MWSKKAVGEQSLPLDEQFYCKPERLPRNLEKRRPRQGRLWKKPIFQSFFVCMEAFFFTRKLAIKKESLFQISSPFLLLPPNEEKQRCWEDIFWSRRKNESADRKLTKNSRRKIPHENRKNDRKFEKKKDAKMLFFSCCHLWWSRYFFAFYLNTEAPFCVQSYSFAYSECKVRISGVGRQSPLCKYSQNSMEKTLFKLPLMAHLHWTKTGVFGPSMKTRECAWWTSMTYNTRVVAISHLICPM